MPDRYVESHIKRNPMFQNLYPEELDLVVKAFQLLRFNPGELVVRQGNPTQGLFILVEGEALIIEEQSNGRGMAVGKLQAGAVLDRGALFSEGSEPTTVRVTQPSVVLFLSRKRMNQVLAYYPEVRQRLGPSDVGTNVQPYRPVQSQSRDASGTLNMQRDDEQVVLIRRRHPWSFIRRGWSAVLLMVLFIVGAVFAFQMAPTLSITLMGLSILIPGLMMTYFFFEWRNDSMVVTTMRVIRIERVIPTFSVQINEIPIDKVQQVNTSLPEGDLFARVFDYGDVELRNASDAGDLVLDMIPNPDEVQEAIFANQRRRQQMASETQRSAIRAEIEGILGLDKTQKQQPVVPSGGGAPSNANSHLVPKSRAPSVARMRFLNDEGDTVIRKHITVWLGAIFAPTLVLVGAAVIFFVTVFSQAGVPGLSILGIPLSVGLGIVGVLWFWWSDWDWRNDMYIISDDTVTLIHKRPLWLQNEVDQVLLNRVDNVVSDVNGLIDTMFQRGTVRISMIGEGLDNAKLLRNIHRPQEVQAELSRRQARAKNQQMEEEARRQRESIAEYISVYHEVQNDTPPYLHNEQGGGEPPPPSYAQRHNPSVQPHHSPDRTRPPGVPRVRRDDYERRRQNDNDDRQNPWRRV